MYKTVEAQLIVKEDDGIIIEVILFAKGYEIPLGAIKIPYLKDKEIYIRQLHRMIPEEIDI